MNFLKKSSADEIEESLSTNIDNINSSKEREEQAKIQMVLASLHEAADLLDRADLEKEADVVTTLLMVLADDAATSGLTSEKMLKNLEEKGWVFNTDDSTMKELDSFLNDDPAPTDDKELVVEEETPVPKTAAWWNIRNKK